ncbi:MAG: class I SAM-dependent methyltransferase [Clostridia bacterium]|nr:class I SAM-dependent methyltransferase [Clostridia bacterium]
MNFHKESEMFNQAAEYYDKYRPGYPEEIIDSLISVTGITEGSDLLEIGCGSGKATEQLTGNSFNILGIDPGEYLVRIGNERFKNESVDFAKGRFEEYDFEQKKFDVVYAAQSFHWVPQPIGYQKCADALKDNGYIALFWNMYLLDDSNADKELLEISKRYGGIADFVTETECERRIDSIVSQIVDSNLFETPTVIRKLWQQDYTVDEFYGFALTGNRFMQNSDDDKQKAYNDIVTLAEKNNGIIKRPYLCVLYIAKKK